MSSKLQLDVVTTVRGSAIWWIRTKAKDRHGVVCRLNCVIHVWAPWGRDTCHLGRYINPRTFTFEWLSNLHPLTRTSKDRASSLRQLSLLRIPILSEAFGRGISLNMKVDIKKVVLGLELVKILWVLVRSHGSGLWRTDGRTNARRRLGRHRALSARKCARPILSYLKMYKSQKNKRQKK